MAKRFHSLVSNFNRIAQWKTHLSNEKFFRRLWYPSQPCPKMRKIDSYRWAWNKGLDQVNCKSVDGFAPVVFLSISSHWNSRWNFGKKVQVQKFVWKRNEFFLLTVDFSVQFLHDTVLVPAARTSLFFRNYFEFSKMNDLLGLIGYGSTTDLASLGLCLYVSHFFPSQHTGFYSSK